MMFGVVCWDDTDPSELDYLHRTAREHGGYFYHDRPHPLFELPTGFLEKPKAVCYDPKFNAPPVDLRFPDALTLKLYLPDSTDQRKFLSRVDFGFIRALFII